MKNKLSRYDLGREKTLDIFGKKADNLKKIADLLILEQDSEKWNISLKDLTHPKTSRP
jgi:D-Tyr-tRNAtyr deacylase